MDEFTESAPLMQKIGGFVNQTQDETLQITAVIFLLSIVSSSPKRAQKVFETGSFGIFFENSRKIVGTHHIKKKKKGVFPALFKLITSKIESLTLVNELCCHCPGFFSLLSKKKHAI